MKLKNSSSAKKRVKTSGSGKKMFVKSAKRHLLINKSKRQKNKFPHGMPISSADIGHIKRILPIS